MLTCATVFFELRSSSLVDGLDAFSENLRDTIIVKPASACIVRVLWNMLAPATQQSTANTALPQLLTDGYNPNTFN